MAVATSALHIDPSTTLRIRRKVAVLYCARSCIPSPSQHKTSAFILFLEQKKKVSTAVKYLSLQFWYVNPLCVEVRSFFFIEEEESMPRQKTATLSHFVRPNYFPSLSRVSLLGIDDVFECAR